MTPELIREMAEAAWRNPNWTVCSFTDPFIPHGQSVIDFMDFFEIPGEQWPGEFCGEEAVQALLLMAEILERI